MSARDSSTRREFIVGAASGLLGAGLAGCGVAAPRVSSMRRQPVTGTAAATLGSPSRAEWSELSRRLAGRLVLPGEPGYATASRLHDTRFDGARPLAIAFCASATDVQWALDFAVARGIRPIPRSGGHSYAGYSTGSGLVIDVTPMSRVAVAQSAGVSVADVGAGARLIDVYAATAAAGVLVPGGSCPTVGIAGLALGGGIGVVGRRYGLTCDQIRSLVAVSADSRVLRVSAGSEPDLYWASRGGGGGNFAIVTSLELQAHQVPRFTLFTVTFPWEAAGELLNAWQTWIPEVPDELWSNCVLDSRQGVSTSGVYTGVGNVKVFLKRLIARVGAEPSAMSVDTNSYLGAMMTEAGCADLSLAQCHLRSVKPDGRVPRAAFLAKSQFIANQYPHQAVSAALKSLEDAGETLKSAYVALQFDSYGGAINAVSERATAFVHRGALCQLQLAVRLAATPTSSDVEGAQAWLARTAGSLATYSDGQAYQNYIDPTLTDWRQAYYGVNLPRLVAVKRHYDPDDVFRFAQSIPRRL